MLLVVVLFMYRLSVTWISELVDGHADVEPAFCERCTQCTCAYDAHVRQLAVFSCVSALLAPSSSSGYRAWLLVVLLFPVPAGLWRTLVDLCVVATVDFRI